MGVAVLALVAWRPLIGDENIKRAQNPLGKDPAAVSAGRERYEEKGCGVCHGAAGGGGRGPRLADSPRLRPMRDGELFKVVKDGVPGTEMPPLDGGETQAWQLVSYLRILNARAIERQVPGRPAAGEALFFGKGGCATCHMVRGRGGLPGPDLSNLGAGRSLEKITESLENPDAAIEPGFAAVTAELRGGRRVTGVARNESDYSIQILDASGNLHLFLKTELRSLTRFASSLMPPPPLSPAERQDVIAYLSRLSVAGPPDAAKEKEP